MVKLLAWNIRHGGGSRQMAPIALAIVEHAPDALVLTEFRRSTGGQIRAILADHGWVHQACTDPPPGRNGVLIASRLPLEASGGARTEKHLEVLIRGLGLRLLGVHIPCDGAGNGPARAEAWRSVLRSARASRGGAAAVMGDFNTGRHHLDEQGATFSHTASLGKLASLGFIDAWRARHPSGREPSWISHTGRGFRIDHAYLSPGLSPRLVDAWYSHRERELRISDHSALLVSLDLKSGASLGATSSASAGDPVGSGSPGSLP